MEKNMSSAVFKGKALLKKFISLPPGKILMLNI
jgi:hypothetical protein